MQFDEYSGESFYQEKCHKVLKALDAKGLLKKTEYVLAVLFKTFDSYVII